jgi:negative regulator of flagellin synthesis FlgM
VQISSVGRTLSEAAQSSGLREERLAQIRAAIADGTYETPEKLEQALARLLQENGLEL